MGRQTLTGNDARQLPSRDERFAAANDNLLKKIRGNNNSDSDIVVTVIEDTASAKFGAIATGNNDSIATPTESDNTVPSLVETATPEEVTNDSVITSDDEVVTTKADIEALLASKVDAMKLELEAKHKVAIEQVRTESDTTKKRKQNLEDLFAIGTTKGNTHPVNNNSDTAIAARPYGGNPEIPATNKFMFDTLGGKKLEVIGDGSPLMREFDSMVRNLTGEWVTVPTKGSVLQRDTRQLDAMVAKDIAEGGKREIANGMEALLKNKGLLQGGDSRRGGSDAISTTADLPSVLFEYLSSTIRVAHYSDLVHWQFANYKVDIGVKPRLQIEVPRHNYLAKPTSYASRQLTQGTRLNANSQPQTEDNQLITVLELGLGLATAGLDSAPIGFSTFVGAFSMFNLEAIIGKTLGYDYQFTKDLALRGQLFRTDAVYYNKGGRAVTSPVFTVPAYNNSSIGKPSGISSSAFINSLIAEARKKSIPPFLNGCYAIIHTPTSWNQYSNEKSAKEHELAIVGMDLITQAMMRRLESEAFGGVVSGFMGTYDGCYHFVQNAYGISDTAGDEGVQNTAFTGASQITRSGFLLGQDTIAWVTALPAEIRFDQVTDFNRERRAVWYSHENAGSLDVKNTLTAGSTRFKELLRVLEFRITDEPLPVV